MKWNSEDLFKEARREGYCYDIMTDTYVKNGQKFIWNHDSQKFESALLRQLERFASAKSA